MVTVPDSGVAELVAAVEASAWWDVLAARRRPWGVDVELRRSP